MNARQGSKLGLVLSAMASVIVASALMGAGSGSCVPVEATTPVLEQTERISACGGFVQQQKVRLAPAADDYCAAEVLHWTYAADEQRLSLTDARMLLNCCGDHAMSAEVVDGVYVVTESDVAGDGGMRCACMCVFDFALDLQGVPAESIPVRLVRYVSEDGESVVWEGTLDLATGAGEVVLDANDVGMWCGDGLAE